MAKILANDGIDSVGKQMLEKEGFTVVTDKIAQADLATQLTSFDGIIVRSATKVTKEIIDACPNLKLIGRAGVGMDNIEVEYAKSKGLAVVNTPAASSQSVAELVFAHLFGMVRFLHQSNRQMPVIGTEKFAELKKNYAEGIELKGKIIGVIGFGRIGQATAKIAIGLGMNVLPYDPFVSEATIDFDFHPELSNDKVSIKFKTVPLEELLVKGDFLTLHVPFPKGAVPIIAKKEFDLMKQGVGIVNAARGGAIHENDLLDALNAGKVAYAGLDVFEGEPTPKLALLQHAKISSTPHIGASTNEAQERIGVELAQRVIDHFKK
ncbi:MAG: D-2-hydroxyacid dehydrogenase [Bacteroidota bacterium]